MVDFNFSDDAELQKLSAQVVRACQQTATSARQLLLPCDNCSARATTCGHKLIRALQTSEPEEFEHWEKLVRAAEAQEGGLNRNSSPQAIAATRETYDQFLARYPLFYGFWKRYADLEFAIAGTEAAEMVSISIRT